MSKLERIKYKPVSVREALVEMKDDSGLMIDLAYSAMLFNNYELCQEVWDLENRIDTLGYILEMNLMIAAKDPDDAEDLVGILKVADATDMIAEAAGDIARLLAQGIGLHPVVRDAFKAARERLVRTKVGRTSPILGKTIGELDLAPRIGMDIIAIRRGKEWIIDPSENERLAEDDILFARGAPRGAKILNELTGGTTQGFE